MSYFEDFIEPYIGFVDGFDTCYVVISKEDTTWTTNKGETLKISEMGFGHAHHVINMLQKKGLPVPDALYERLSKEKAEMAKGFDIEI